MKYVANKYSENNVLAELCVLEKPFWQINCQKGMQRSQPWRIGEVI
jgi:hypothetical protein